MTRYLKSTRTLATATLIAASMIALPIAAQPAEGEKKDAKKKDMSRPALILEQGSVLGAVVTNGQDGEQRVELGTISDLVFNGKTGELEHAVIASGGTLGVAKKQTAIAWKKMAHDAKRGFTIAMTPERLAKLPAFDPAKLELAPASARVKEGAASDDPKEKGSAKMAGGALMLASQFSECKVLAGLDELGTGATFCLAPEQGRLAFARISVGEGAEGRTLIVPWAALRVVQPVGKTKAHVLLPKSQKELESAPQLEQAADLQRGSFRQRVYRFYEVTPPAWDRAPAGFGAGS